MKPEDLYKSLLNADRETKEKFNLAYKRYQQGEIKQSMEILEALAATCKSKKNRS